MTERIRFSAQDMVQVAHWSNQLRHGVDPAGVLAQIRTYVRREIVKGRR